jgi:hypothetical protein
VEEETSTANLSELALAADTVVAQQIAVRTTTKSIINILLVRISTS